MRSSLPDTTPERYSTDAFGEGTPEEELAAFVDAAKCSRRRGEELVQFLPEQHPIYRNRSANGIIRLRGYVLAAFEQTGTPQAAVPYILEELESGGQAYLVAAAAKALRGLDEPPPGVVRFLFKSVENIRSSDDSLTFESYKPRWPVAAPTTALKELFITFGSLGARARDALPGLENLLADGGKSFTAPIRAEIEKAVKSIRADETEADEGCCSMPNGLGLFAQRFRREPTGRASVASVVLEDQNGDTLAFGDFFSGKPSVVVFFYTRCDNPNKCSLSVTKLACLQRAIAESGLGGRLKTAAITYDPAYDLPRRLKAYGLNRGVQFGDDDRIMRARNGLKELADYFDLGVSLAGSIVNRHRIELFILDGRGRIVHTLARLQWDVNEVLCLARSVLEAGGSPAETTCRPQLRRSRFARMLSRHALSTLPPLLAALLPKCPLCWAAYLSALGITSMQGVRYGSRAVYVLMTLMLANLLLVYRRARQRKDSGAFYLSASGVFLALAGLYFNSLYASYSGAAMIFFGSLLSSLSSGVRLSPLLFINRGLSRFGGRERDTAPDLRH